ncbi:MAG: carboxymuconolactone decarboxylase family protein [bacterium]|nr:hypothetical protein [bacterium]MBU1918970.1 hypothetical protein [bacterium]
MLGLKKINDILTDDNLQKLRDNYKEKDIFKLVEMKMGVYAPFLDYAKNFIDANYTKPTMKAKCRERTLIAILAQNKEAFPLAAHVYWGLMEGLIPEEIADTLLLSGAYNGYPTLNFSLEVLVKTLHALNEHIMTNMPLDALNVLKGLSEIFKS